MSRFFRSLLADVIDRFGCSKRTAQRWMRRLESSFGDVEVTRDSEGRNRWRRRLTDMREMLTPTVEEFPALEAALQSAHARGQDAEHAALLSLSKKIRALIPAAHARRLEPDFEAILEAQGYAARPRFRRRIALFQGQDHHHVTLKL